MGDVMYERPDRSTALGPEKSFSYENPRAGVVSAEEPPVEQSAGDKASTAAVATGVGAGAGLSAYVLRGLMRRGFPGVMPKAAALRKLDAAIKRSESSSGLKQKFSQYMREVSNTEKPITFADFMAQQSGHGNANAIIKDMVSHSGNIPAIDEKLSTRTAGAKDRVLDDLAGALSVPKQSVVMGKDALIEQRKANAEPLYNEAFADDQPIRDARFFRLFESPTARSSLKEAVKNAEDRLKPIEVRAAANPRRKDWWKRANVNDIPEGLFLDDEESASGLRRYISPNMRNADAIQKSIRQQMEAAMKEDPTTGYMKHTERSRALNDLHKEFMQTMYDVAPNDKYRAARDAFAGDSTLLDAHKVGAELLSMTPDEVRKELATMGPDERATLASGFYGSLHDMKQQKLLRELVARPDRYPEIREKLGAVFPDKAKLSQFLENLKGEQAMTDSAAVFGNPPASKDPGPRLPSIRMTSPIGGGLDAKLQAIEYLKSGDVGGMIPRGIQRSSRAGTDMLFRDPQLFGYGASHPDWNTVNSVPMSGLERLRSAGKFTGAGALGGLGAYGMDQLGDLNLAPKDYVAP